MKDLFDEKIKQIMHNKPALILKDFRNVTGMTYFYGNIKLKIDGIPNLPNSIKGMKFL